MRLAAIVFLLALPLAGQSRNAAYFGHAAAEREPVPGALERGEILLERGARGVRAFHRSVNR